MTKFVIPEWMEPYEAILGGRDEVLRLMSGEREDVQINGPLALMQNGMSAQVDMMHRLYKSGMLMDPRPNPADPTPQQTYENLMGVSGEQWSWWAEWADPYGMYGVGSDTRTVPDDWTVTGKIADPDDPNERITIPFELNHAKILAAVKRLAFMPNVREEVVRECRQLLANADSCDFDADSGDAVLQIAVLGDIVYG